MTLTEKVAYLKGLAAGLELDKDSKETKIFEAMFDILEDMALTVSDIDEDLSAVEDLVDAIDEDLDELEEYVFCDEDDDFCGCCDCEDDELYEVECPSCGEEIYLDDEMLDFSRRMKASGVRVVFYLTTTLRSTESLPDDIELRYKLY